MITCRFSIGKNKVEGNEVNQAKEVSEIHFVSVYGDVDNSLDHAD